MDTAVSRVSRNLKHVAVLAFGTVGDVLPIAVVTAKLAVSLRSCNVTFVTHSSHEFLRSLLTLSGVQFLTVTTPPISSPCDNFSSEDKQADSLPSGDSSYQGRSCKKGWRRSEDEEHRRQCLLAVDPIFNSEVEGTSSLIIFNLFALEGWHLAEVYRVPCAVAAPYVVPYSAPASFERSFRTEQPLLYARLKRARPPEVCWSEVIHWMWPIFTNRWTVWRTDTLRLSACPLTDPVTELPISHSWPLAPPLLYGFSPEVVECPEYWPKSVHACGFWYPPEEWETLVGRESESFSGPFLRFEIESCSSFGQNLFEFLSRKDGNDLPVYIGLSSVGSMGYITDPETFLDVILTVLETCNKRGILHSSSYAPLDSIIRQKIKTRTKNKEGELHCDRLEDGGVVGERLFCFSQLSQLALVPVVSHNWLFPMLSVIFHHGGSGTTAAAIRAGVPQVICPFFMDQFYWAERMAWIGVAPDPLKPKTLFPKNEGEFKDAVSTISSAVDEASSSYMRQRATELGQRIRLEDGATTFVRTLLEEMTLE